MEELVLVPLYNDQDVYALGAGYDWRPPNDGSVRVALVRLRGASPSP